MLVGGAACQTTTGGDPADDLAAPISPDEPPGDPPETGGNGSGSGMIETEDGVMVTVSVAGPGRITSKPTGIDCGGGATDCAARFTGDALVLVTDEATTVRWSDACSGNGDCALALDADRSVTAETFAPLRRTFDGDDQGDDFCMAIAAGPGDSLVFAGATRRIAQGHNAWARAYDAEGTALWTYELSTPSEGHDRSNGLLVLPDGSALVAGLWFSGSSSRWNSFLLGIDPAGRDVVRQTNQIVGDDEYIDIARDAGGRIYLAGYRPDATGQTQAWIRATSADGRTEHWSATRNGGAVGADSATGIAIDPSGDIVVVGTELNADTGTDGWLARYSPDGALRSSNSFASPGSDSIHDVAVGPDGGIALLGSFDGARALRVLGSGGEPRWDVTATDDPSWGRVAIDAAGNVVVAGTLGTELVTRKYSAGGDLVWQRRVGDARGGAVAIGDHGNVLVCGSTEATGNGDALAVVFVQ
jgi:hypothetical protein